MLYLFSLLVLCILASTAFSTKLNKLYFKIQQFIWIRPAVRNVQSYHFAKRFWQRIAVLSLVFAVGILIMSDLRPLFCISILAPFYALWGFVASRKKEVLLFNEPDPPPEPAARVAPMAQGGSGQTDILPKVGIFRFLLEACASAPIFVFSIVMLNSLVYFVLLKDTACANLWITSSFQILTMLLFYWFYRKYCSVQEKNPSATDEETHAVHYLSSLKWLIFLVCFVPVCGFFMYGFQSEKIQFVKNKQLAIAQAFENRAKIIYSDITQHYKPALTNDPIFRKFIDSLEFFSSFYLSDKDSVKFSKQPLGSSDQNFVDRTYISLMDSLFLVSPTEYERFSIKNSAVDDNWFFVVDSGKIRLDYKLKNSASDGMHMIVSSNINSAVQYVKRGSKEVLVVLVVASMILLVLSDRLLNKTMKRIFLVEFFVKSPKPDDSLLETFILPTVRSEKGYESGTVASLDEYFALESARKSVSIEAMEDKIVSRTIQFEKAYDQLWYALTAEEKYFLYDFAIDGYANYKDAIMLTSLTKKRMLKFKKSHFRLFSNSFRNYLLGKSGSHEIARLRAVYAAPGIWETMRIPVLVLISVSGIFIFATQDDFSHKLSAVLTSIGALIPLLMKFINSSSSPSN
jgi:hypothetical protein